MSVVWKTYSIPHDWTVGSELLRHTIGVVSDHVCYGVGCELTLNTDPLRPACVVNKGIV